MVSYHLLWFIFFFIGMQSKNTITWVAKIIAAAIMMQTLFFKFTAAPEAVALFTKLWMEPTWRIGIGVLELVAWLLLLFGGKYSWLWAILGAGLMVGALYFHLTILWIDQLFRMAIIVLIACVRIMYSTDMIVKIKKIVSW